MARKLQAKLKLGRPRAISEAVLTIAKKELDRHKVVTVFDALPAELAFAVEHTIKTFFPKAVMQPVAQPGFLGSVNIVRPNHIDVPVTETGSVKILWGTWTVPELAGQFQLAPNGAQAFISGTINVKTIPQYNAFVEGIKKSLAVNRLYKGRALKVSFSAEGNVPNMLPPIALKGINRNALILNTDVEQQVEASVFAILQQTAKVKELGVPRKRGILLEGKYGVGKTLIAGITASMAVENRFTFLLVNSSEGLGHAFEFAKRYGRTVVFVEDLDQVAHNDRDELNTILNTIDGLDAKGEEILIIATTNFVERIDPSFLRPGRIDHVIHIAEPNEETRARMIRFFAGDLLHPLEDITDTLSELDSATPAMVRESVERAKLLMIAKGQGRITPTMLKASADSLRRQRELTTPKMPVTTPMQEFGSSFGKHVSDAMDAIQKKW